MKYKIYLLAKMKARAVDPKTTLAVAKTNMIHQSIINQIKCSTGSPCLFAAFNLSANVELDSKKDNKEVEDDVPGSVSSGVIFDFLKLIRGQGIVARCCQ